MQASNSDVGARKCDDVLQDDQESESDEGPYKIINLIKMEDIERLLAESDDEEDDFKLDPDTGTNNCIEKYVKFGKFSLSCLERLKTIITSSENRALASELVETFHDLFIERKRLNSVKLRDGRCELAEKNFENVKQFHDKIVLIDPHCECPVVREYMRKHWGKFQEFFNQYDSLLSEWDPLSDDWPERKITLTNKLEEFEDDLSFETTYSLIPLMLKEIEKLKLDLSK